MQQPRASGLARASVPWLLAVALLLVLSPSAPTRTTFATESISMPFPGGKAIRIIQGYNGGTHQGRSQYGLDLMLANEETTGAEVVSPVDGSVTFSRSPGSGNGCIGIAFRNDSYSVMLCHVILHRPFNRGESVARGQSLGTVGKAGTVGNNGTPHVHLELHRGGNVSNPVPFSEPGGLLLEGVALAATGKFSEHGSREPIVSTNRGGTEAAGSTVARGSQRTQQMSAEAEPVTLIAASVPSSVRSVPASGATASSGATRLAVVHGTESCLKVREKPSTNAPVVECLREGTELPLKPIARGTESGWRQVDLGWVSDEYLKRTQAVVVGTDACLNVREGPKSGALVLGCLPDGTSVKIIDGPTSGDGTAWYKIEKTGSLKKDGWVSGKHLD